MYIVQGQYKLNRLTGNCWGVRTQNQHFFLFHQTNYRDGEGQDNQHILPAKLATYLSHYEHFTINYRNIVAGTLEIPYKE